MSIIGYQTVPSDYREMTMEQLRGLCDRRSVVYSDRMDKQALIDRLVTVDHKLKGWTSIIVMAKGRKVSGREY